MTFESIERVQAREWKRRPDRGPLYIVRSDGAHERLTRRYEPLSGALLWPLMLALLGLAFAAGTVHGRANPIPNTPVAEMHRGW